MAKLLVEHKAHPGATSASGGNTAVAAAVGNDHVEMCAQLLQWGAGKNRDTLRDPLTTAAEKGNVEMCRLLVQHNAPMHWKTVQCAVDGKHHQIMELLKLASLAVAVHMGDEKAVEQLLQRTPKVDLEEEFWSGSLVTSSLDTPLTLAVKNGQLSIARALLRHGARTENPERSRIPNPLSLAVETGNIDMCRLLLNFHAKPLKYLPNTALDNAVAGGRVEASKVLVACGLSLRESEKTSSGYSTGAKPHLAVAASMGHVDMCKWLLEQKMDPCQADFERVTALGHARIDQVVELLAQVRLTLLLLLILRRPACPWQRKAALSSLSNAPSQHRHHPTSKSAQRADSLL